MPKLFVNIVFPIILLFSTNTETIDKTCKDFDQVKAKEVIKSLIFNKIYKEPECIDGKILIEIVNA